MTTKILNKFYVIRQQLQELYTNNQNRFITVSDILEGHDPHGPYLSSPGEAYSQQQNPLLVIGQESYGWGKFPEIDK